MLKGLISYTNIWISLVANLIMVTAFNLMSPVFIVILFTIVGSLIFVRLDDIVLLKVINLYVGLYWVALHISRSLTAISPLLAAFVGCVLLVTIYLMVKMELNPTNKPALERLKAVVTSHKVKSADIKEK